MIMGILALLVIYLLISVVLSLLSTRPQAVDCTDRKTIYITSNGIHLNFVFPKSLLETELTEHLNIPSSATYIAFGWGDRGFYLNTPTWKQLKFGVAMRALLLKSETAMHVTPYYRPSDAWKKLPLCTEQLETLKTYISASFDRDEQNRIMEIAGAGYTSQDKFYEATGSYTCLKTCNNWVNIGLKRARVRTAVWSPFDFGVLFHLGKVQDKRLIYVPK